MTERPIEVVNRLGLHARAAAKLVHLANRFACDVTLVRDGQETDAKSILGILMLAAGQGTQLVLRCDGADEERAADEIDNLFSRRFEEES